MLLTFRTAGQILAPLKKDFYRGFSQWTHLVHAWFRMNNRNPNITQPMTSSMYRWGGLGFFAEADPMYDGQSTSPDMARQFYTGSDVTRMCAHIP